MIVIQMMRVRLQKQVLGNTKKDRRASREEINAEDIPLETVETNDGFENVRKKANKYKGLIMGMRKILVAQIWVVIRVILVKMMKVIVQSCHLEKQGIGYTMI